MAGMVGAAKGLSLKFQTASLWTPLTEHGTEGERFWPAVGQLFIWGTGSGPTVEPGVSSRSGSVRWTQSLAEEK